MSNILKIAGAGVSAAAEETDENFNQTVLLLHGDGTNGAQNNTFLDGSTNNFTITRNGNTTQGTFSPFSAPDGRWSNYLNSTSAYIRTPTSSDFSLSTNNFCYEGWIWAVDPEALSYSRCFGIGPNYGNVNSFGVNIADSDSSDNITVYWSDGTLGRKLISSTRLPANQWNHLAVVRNGSNFALFLNGTRIATYTSANAIGSGDTYAFVGHTGTNTEGYIGYFSNVRLVNGASVYDPTQTTITVPTTPLTNIANTKLLVGQSNRFVDNSTNNFAITRNGDVKVTPFSPFAPTAAYDASVNGGSGYFDGSGDYLQLPTDSINLTGDFTIECWAYITTYSVGDAFSSVYMISESNGGSAATIALWSLEVGAQADPGTLRFKGFRTSPAFELASSAGLVPLNSWNHLAATRSGTTVSLYFNGQVVDTDTVSGQIFGNPNTWTTRIGHLLYPFGPSRFFPGYIANFRILDGTAIDFASTGIPTAPPTAIANTSLLLNFTNAGIFDNTGKNNLETVADAQIDTTTKQFGTGSMEFDGTGDYLTTTGAGVFGTGDFTVEFWVNPSSVALSDIIDTRPGTDNAGAWAVQYDGTNLYWAGDGTSVLNVPVAQTPIGSWTHVAYTRESGTMKVWINGTQYGSSVSKTNNYTQTRFDIGVAVRTYYFTGYIDDLRITKGVARYTTTFTPPTKAFPDL